MIGKSIGHYHIAEQIGAGGMGVVFRARDEHLDRIVALKVLPDEKVADPDRKRRFVQEAKSASALNHPNIITVYDIAEADGVQFIAMEYVHGKTLDQLIGRTGLRLGDALTYATQIASAIATAHEAGIVHRDLKPSNIMIREDGLVKVLDFGLAKLIELGEPSTQATTRALGLLGNVVTQPGLIVGTAAYMSPEQAEGRKLDARSDIFSFGSVLYEMISGHRAFRGESPVGVLSAVLLNDPKPISEIVSDVPQEVEKLIERCLRKEPERRFQHMADVRIVLEDLKQGSSTTARTDAQRQVPTSTFAWAGALLLGLVLVGAGIMLRSRPSETAPSPSPPRPIPFTTFSGRELEPAVSPDGKQVAFVWNGERGDNFDIYVKLVAVGTPLRLTTNPGEDRFPAWSPDGRYIAFCRRSSRGAEIISVPALGGTERKLGAADVSWPASGYYLTENPFGLAWSPDGKSLATIEKASEHEPNHITLLSDGTGEKRRITNPPPGYYGDWLPALSPDGRHLAFVRLRGYMVGDLYVVALTGEGSPAAEPKRVTHDERDILGLTWTSDGGSLVFSSNRGGNQRLWKVAPSGGSAEQVVSAGENAFSVSISRRNRVLTYTRQTLNANIWQIPGPGARQESPATKHLPVKLISSTVESWAPQFSPDGKKIAFKSSRSGSEEIWVCDSDGSNPVQLTSFNGPATGIPHWSPDGQRIAFFSRQAGHADIYIVGAQGGQPHRLTNETADESFPSWSNDGSQIYFSSNRTGPWEIWKMPADGGTAIQITRTGGLGAVESPDGKSVYFSRRGARGIWNISVDGGAEVQTLPTGTWGAWALARNGIYVIEQRDSDPAIKFFDFATRRTTQIASLPKEAALAIGGHSMLAVSPGATSILFVQLDRVESDLVMLENFR